MFAFCHKTTAATAFGALPLVCASGAGTAGRFAMGLVIDQHAAYPVPGKRRNGKA